MAEYMTLMGAERVADAASSMRSSAETMSRAASTMDEACMRLTRALDEHARIIEVMLERQQETR